VLGDADGRLMLHSRFRHSLLHSVPEAAFATFFVNPGPGDPVEVISRLTGVTVGELHGLWRGPRGLRQAALRYALGMAMG
jgi:hypothetical protein